MYCEFTSVEQGNIIELTCLRCGRSLAVPKSITDVKATCRLTTTDGLERYAIWQNDQLGWRFTWLTPRVAIEFSPCPLDDSRVGTRLKKIFEKRGYTPKSCHCDYLANMFDQANLELLHKEREKAVDLIVNSAKMMNVKVSRFVISMLFSYVLKKEAARIKGNGKPPLSV